MAEKIIFVTKVEDDLKKIELLDDLALRPVVCLSHLNYIINNRKEFKKVNITVYQFRHTHRESYVLPWEPLVIEAIRRQKGQDDSLISLRQETFCPSCLNWLMDKFLIFLIIEIQLDNRCLFKFMEEKNLFVSDSMLILSDFKKISDSKLKT